MANRKYAIMSIADRAVFGGGPVTSAGRRCGRPGGGRTISGRPSVPASPISRSRSGKSRTDLTRLLVGLVAALILMVTGASIVGPWNSGWEPPGEGVSVPSGPSTGSASLPRLGFPPAYGVPDVPVLENSGEGPLARRALDRTLSAAGSFDPASLIDSGRLPTAHYAYLARAGALSAFATSLPPPSIA